MQLWHPYSGEREAALDGLIAAFNAEHGPDLALQAESYGDTGLLHDQVLLQLTNAGPLPNLIITWPHDIALFDLSNVIVDLAPVPSISEATHARGYTPAREKLIGIPTRTFVTAMYVNQTALEELGYTDPPQTGAQLVEMACAFRQAGGWSQGRFGNTWGVVMPTSAEIVLGLVARQAGTLYSSDVGLVVDSEEMRNTVEMIADIQSQGCGITVDAPLDGLAAFAEGRALLYFGSTSSLTLMRDEILANFAEPFDWRVVPLPGDGASLSLGPVISTVDQGPAANQAAYQFIEWFLQAENNAAWNTATGSLPSHPQAVDLMSEAFDGFPQWKEAQALASEQVTALPALASYDVLRLMLQFGVQRVVSNAVPVVDELPALQHQLTDIWQDFMPEDAPADD
ncbi:MAG: extracellular solute-binding protein [Chloroflexi bacterium]|nr:extracellular solute-binding protein [Chloroflexota bacterium]